MRYIEIPTKPIVLLAPDGSPGLKADGTPADPITFKGWLKSNVLVDLKFGKTAKDLMQSFDIGQKLEKANGVLELAEAEWEAVKDAVNEPTGGYNPHVALQLLPFIRAMLDASDSHPKEKPGNQHLEK